MLLMVSFMQQTKALAILFVMHRLATVFAFYTPKTWNCETLQIKSLLKGERIHVTTNHTPLM